MSMKPAEVALAYARAGFPIFPCHHDGEVAKKPLTKNGLKNATNDLATVAQWWERNPDALIGLPTGEASGLWVLDLDMPKFDERQGRLVPGGRETLSELGLGAVLNDAIVVSTRSGGLHAYFKHDPDKGYGNTAGARGKGLGDGIDSRSDGGYTIAPGSPGYQFINGGSPDFMRQARPIPEALHEALERVPRERKEAERAAKKAAAPTSAPESAKPATQKQVDALGRSIQPAVDAKAAYAEAALAAELDNMRRAASGTRNHTLNACAFSLGSLVGAGLLSQERVERELTAVALMTGLDLNEIANTLPRSLADGAREPREVPEGEFTGIVHYGAVAAPAIAGAPAPGAGPVVATTGGVALPEGYVPGAGGMPRRVFARGAPFALGDGTGIPRRSWLFGYHYVRKFVSVTLSPGGVGKSSYTMAEGLSMASGKKITSTFPPREPARVFIWNGEDPQEELERRMTALALHHEITPEMIGDRLTMRSGRDMPLKLAVNGRNGAELDRPLVEEIVDALHGYDAIIVDPFVSSHMVNENDNMAIDLVVKAWAEIAERLNAAVELVHHSRKPAGGFADNQTTDDDARGAGAIKGAARAMRVLNRMNSQQAKNFEVPDGDKWRYINVGDGKQNMSAVSTSGTWFKMESHELPNGGAMSDHGDSVGVVTAWEPPTPVDPLNYDRDKGIAFQNVLRAADAANELPTMAGQRIDAGGWVGFALIEVCGAPVNEQTKKAAKRLLDDFEANGVVVKGERRGEKSRIRKVYEVGPNSLSSDV